MMYNNITKKGGKKPVQLDVGVGYNGAGDGFTENASVSGSYNGFNYRLSGSYADFGDLRTPDKTIDGTDYDTRSGSIFLSYDFTDDLTMGVNADYFEGNFNTATDDAETYDDFAVRIQPWKRQKFAFFADATNLNEYWARLRFDAYTQKTDKKMQNIVGILYQLILQKGVQNEKVYSCYNYISSFIWGRVCNDSIL